MAASVLPLRFYNPRGTRDLSYPFDDRESTAGSSYAKVLDDLDDRLRVDFANLEGDFPRPSSLTPDKGVIQYFYHDDAQYTFRDDRRDKFRGPYRNLPVDVPGKYRGTQTIYAGNTEFAVPANNTWRMTLELDDARRDMQNLDELGVMSFELVTRPGWDITEGSDGFDNWEDDSVVDILPMKVEFTTSSRWAAISNENPRVVFVDDEYKEYKNTIYVPPGATVRINYKTQEGSGIPNEDLNYLSVGANDASWERGRPTTVNFLGASQGYEFEDELNGDGELAWTYKPHENPADQPAKIRVVSTNYDTNEDAFYYDTSGPDGFIEKVEDTHIVDDARTSTRSTIGFWFQLRDTITNLLDKSETDTAQSGIHNRAMRTVTNANAFPYVAGEEALNTWQDGQPLVRHFWSAAAVSYVLTTAEMRALRTQSALDYAMYGEEIDWRDWNNVRKYDIAVFKFKNASGGHVGFITDVDLSTNKVKIAGGNQSNKFKETEYLIDSVNMYLLTVRRNWVAASNATVV